MDIELLTLLQVVIAPLLLAAAIIYGIIRYRQRGQSTKQLTEDATRDLYRRGAEQEQREQEQREQESPPLSPAAEAERESRQEHATRERLRP
jgi:hypothetical protein